MDPVPIDNRNSTCNEILATASKLATIFRNAAGLYSDLASTFTKFSFSCTSFAEAVQAIQLFLTDGSEKRLLDSAPWYQLNTSLGRAEKVITVLQDEVQSVLRPRYESRSRSRFSTEWDLEGMKSSEEDVQHETRTLQQILQYMRLLEIAGVTPRAQAGPHEATEERDVHRTSIALVASIPGGSQADTETTLDRPAPPYNLVDVRSKETHTKWHPDQSVVAADHTTPELPLVTEDAANEHNSEARRPSASITDLVIDSPRLGLSDGHWPASRVRKPAKEILIFIHDKVYNVSSFIDKHPGGEEVLLDIAGEDATEAFEDVGHSDEAREVLNSLLVGERTKQSIVTPKRPNSSKYQFQVNNVEISFDNRWPWQTSELKFIDSMQVEKDLREPTRQIMEIMKTAINKLCLLLTTIRPYFKWGGNSDIEQFFVQIDTFWKLCMSIRAMFCNSGLRSYQQMPRVTDIIARVHFLVGHLATIAQSSLMSDAHLNKMRHHDRSGHLGATNAFVFKVKREYGKLLTELVQSLVGLNLWLLVRSTES